jgi:hypothetical protein
MKMGAICFLFGCSFCIDLWFELEQCWLVCWFDFITTLLDSVNPYLVLQLNWELFLTFGFWSWICVQSCLNSLMWLLKNVWSCISVLLGTSVVVKTMGVALMYWVVGDKIDEISFITIVDFKTQFMVVSSWIGVISGWWLWYVYKTGGTWFGYFSIVYFFFFLSIDYKGFCGLWLVWIVSLGIRKRLISVFSNYYKTTYKNLNESKAKSSC